jgi:hypothetical protein
MIGTIFRSITGFSQFVCYCFGAECDGCRSEVRRRNWFSAEIFGAEAVRRKQIFGAEGVS